MSGIDVSSDFCRPSWAGEELCPFGTEAGLLFTKYTWPNESGRTVLTYIAAGYSLFPLLGAFGPMLFFLATRGTRELATLFISMLSTAVMLLLKLCFHHPRPTGSCLLSCGMPSGHSMQSICLLTWLMLEVWYGTGALQLLPGNRSEFFVSALLCCVCVPVGWSRVELHDHSILQVCAGSFVGFLVGLLWFSVMRSRLLWWLCRWMTKYATFINMNYCHPESFTADLDQPWQPCRPAAGSQASYSALGAAPPLEEG